MTSVVNTMTSLSIKQVEQKEVFDFRAMRLDWFRLQVGDFFATVLGWAEKNWSPFKILCKRNQNFPKSWQTEKFPSLFQNNRVLKVVNALLNSFS